MRDATEDYLKKEDFQVRTQVRIRPLSAKSYISHHNVQKRQ